jgi:hypothetical protein
MQFEASPLSRRTTLVGADNARHAVCTCSRVDIHRMFQPAGFGDLDVDNINRPIFGESYYIMRSQNALVSHYWDSRLSSYDRQSLEIPAR